MLECCIIFGITLMWGFYALLNWIKYEEVNLDYLIRLLSGGTLGCVFGSLIYWFGYYLWPIFCKN